MKNQWRTKSVPVSELTEKDLVAIVVEQAREYFGKNYSFLKDKDGESFTFEIYTDYSNMLSDDTINEALKSSKTIEDARFSLYDHIHEGYIDTMGDYETDNSKEVVDYMENNLDAELIERLKEFDLLDSSEVRCVLLDYGVLSVVVDSDEILGRSEVDMVISLENDVSVDREFSLNSFRGDLSGWIEDTQELLNEGDIIEEDISLITLLKTQGYTFEGFKAQVDGYFNIEGFEVADKFISSLINECENATSSLNALVFTTRVNLSEYLNEEVTINSINTKMVGGYMDFIHGGGSILELELNNDIDLSEIAHEVFMDGSKYCYGISEVYGHFLVNN